MRVTEHDPDERLGDDPPADRPQSNRRVIRAELLLRFGEDVVPERRLMDELPTEPFDLRELWIPWRVVLDGFANPKLVVWNDALPHRGRDVLPGRKPHAQSAQQIARGERTQVGRKVERRR